MPVVTRAKERATSSPEQQIDEAHLAAERRDFESSVSLLRPLADLGHVEAMYQLGRLAFTECELITGEEAFGWLQSAASLGHPDATYDLATFPDFLDEGFSSPYSAAEALQVRILAAELGSAPAQYDLAARLATGDDGSVAPDLAGALEWYRRAAVADHPEAQFNLAFMLLRGEGCTPDRDEAMRWLEEAKSRGHEQAGQLLEDLQGSI